MTTNLSESDVEFFGAFADLLNKFPEQRGRFNLRLDHSHFDVADEEVLMEHHDAASRVLTTKVIQRADLAPDAMEVEWRVERSEDGLNIKLVQGCCGEDLPPVIDGSHSLQH